MTNPIQPAGTPPLAQPRAPAQRPRPAVRREQPASAFAEVLHKQMQPGTRVRFSAHAQQRLESRGIDLAETELAQLETAVEAAAEKGGRESLVLLDQAALVVSIPNRTVITAMTMDEAGQTVITNIDSAVLARSAPAPETATDGLDPMRGSPGAAERPMRHISME